LGLGVPFSSASYALLTCRIAHVCVVFFNSILIYQALMLLLIHEIAI
jgi:thymidylate synthase